VLKIEIPSPIEQFSRQDPTAPIDPKFEELANGETTLVSRGHGKIFVKFSQHIAAKQARYGLSGRTYNGRTVVTAFYPEHLFD